MSSVNEKVRTSGGKDCERPEKKDSGEAPSLKHGDGHDQHHEVEEEVQSYALENAFSWPVSLVMGLNHDEHHHQHPHGQPKRKHEKLDKKEVQYAVENAFSWPVSFVMHVVNESQGHKGSKQESEKQPGCQVTGKVEGRSH
ncbi:hypothetical protein R1sor_005873 [Riccia sorocarpa]|uniref:Uncharacterized protein n=1 Tax=Riccia sorocarpa TaxID=122646 RepID=A0ABD3HL19_9MARC